MTIKGLIKKVLEKPVRSIIGLVLEKPVRSIIGLGLAGLITITAVKNNVHFGSVALYNPQENHYTWGLAPTTEIKGNAKGNFYTAGLILGENKLADNIILDGDMSAYGVFNGYNNIGDNSKVNDMSAYGVIFGYNNIGDNSKVNDMSAYGLFGINSVGNNTEINGDIITKAIVLETPFGFGSKDIIGLKNYVHKLKKIDKEK